MNLLAKAGVGNGAAKEVVVVRGVPLQNMSLEHLEPMVRDGLRAVYPNGITDFFLLPLVEAERTAYAMAAKSPPMKMHLEEKGYTKSFHAHVQAVTVDFADFLETIRGILSDAAPGAPERNVLEKIERQYVTLKALEAGLRDRISVLVDRGINTDDAKFRSQRVVTELMILNRHGGDKTYISAAADRAKEDQWGHVLQAVGKAAAKSAGDALVAAANKPSASNGSGKGGGKTNNGGGGNSGGKGGGNQGGGGRSAGDKAPPAPANRS